MLTLLHSFIVKLAMRHLLCIQLCTAVPANADILPSLQALHLEMNPPAMQKEHFYQNNDSQIYLGGSNTGVPNQPPGIPS